MKFYVTKYALTQGIYEIDGETVIGAYVKGCGSDASFWGALGTDACETHDAAVLRAEKMRSARIASLKKSIEKLEKLTFKRTV